MTGFGIVYRPERGPDGLAAAARQAERAGYDELWLWEDCFLSGGIASAATALAATERIAVGLGIMPAVFRNAAATAMEAGTLANLYPGRFIAGLGHGVPSWMEQIGALPSRPLAALEEVTVAVRRLLAGEAVTCDGEHVRLQDVRLDQPPRVPPAVVLGVRRPLGLRVSGRCADGSLLASPAPPAYVSWARARIDEGRASAGRTDPHRLTVLVEACIGADRAAVRRELAELVLHEGVAIQLEQLGRDDELPRLRALGDPEAIGAAMSDELADQLGAVGRPAQVIAAARRLIAAGADALAFIPMGPNVDAQVERLAQLVLPALRAAR